MRKILGKKEAEYLDNVQNIENSLINGHITDQQFNDKLDELRADYQEENKGTK
jgi:hypothetical protein